VKQSTRRQQNLHLGRLTDECAMPADSFAVVAAVELFRGMLVRSHGFKARVPRTTGYELSWNSSGLAAIATFWYRLIPVTTSVLLAGGGPTAEEEVIREFQGLVIRIHRDTPVEPAWDLAGIVERPMIASLILPSAYAAGQEAVGMIADMETCLAAAYFLLQEEAA
jgi:hypothetical protein